MVQEPLKEKVTNLEIKQAVVEVTMGELKTDIESLRNEVNIGFCEIRRLIFKGLVGIIGILLTALGYFIKIG